MGGGYEHESGSNNSLKYFTYVYNSRLNNQAQTSLQIHLHQALLCLTTLRTNISIDDAYPQKTQTIFLNLSYTITCRTPTFISFTL